MTSWTSTNSAPPSGSSDSSCASAPRAIGGGRRATPPPPRPPSRLPPPTASPKAGAGRAWPPRPPPRPRPRAALPGEPIGASDGGASGAAARERPLERDAPRPPRPPRSIYRETTDTAICVRGRQKDVGSQNGLCRTPKNLALTPLAWHSVDAAACPPFPLAPSTWPRQTPRAPSPWRAPSRPPRPSVPARNACI